MPIQPVLIVLLAQMVEWLVAARTIKGAKGMRGATIGFFQEEWCATHPTNMRCAQQQNLHAPGVVSLSSAPSWHSRTHKVATDL
ncbi:hypothetical protein GE09DRAFT_1113889 [Coniochaeta sp. 2T2.1]|nr:hypothetical protein GE09DRAFT_1113889 [Coniochaeta sp. 2T2.1]